jgi:hypothetical protein
MAEKQTEQRADCPTCTTSLQAGTWTCAECGSMNVSKWKECWKCKSPRSPT